LLDRMRKFGINPRDVKLRYGISDDVPVKAQYAFA
jgi:hypothetical protein